MQKAINKFEHATTQQWWSGDCSSSHVKGTNSLQIFIVIDLEKHKRACNIRECMKKKIIHTWCTCHAPQSWRSTCLQRKRKRKINWYFLRAFLDITIDNGHCTWKWSKYTYYNFTLSPWHRVASSGDVNLWIRRVDKGKHFAKNTADKETATVYLPHYIRKEGLTPLKEKERMELMLSISSLRVSGSPNRKPTLMCMLNIFTFDRPSKAVSDKYYKLWIQRKSKKEEVWKKNNPWRTNLVAQRKCFKASNVQWLLQIITFSNCPNNFRIFQCAQSFKQWWSFLKTKRWN